MVSLNRGNVVDRSSAAASAYSVHKKTIPLHQQKSGKSTERERDDTLFERDTDNINMSQLNLTKDTNSNNNTFKSKLTDTGVSLIAKMKEIESKFEYKDVLADYESQLNNQPFHFRDNIVRVDKGANHYKN